MSQDEIENAPEANPTAEADVEMEEGVEGTEAAEGEKHAEENEAGGEEEPEKQKEEPPEAHASFISHLMSPVVTLLIGTTEQTVLSAHQSLLVRSPFFAEACKSFVDDGSPRQVELPDDDIDAVGCFLEYLYTGEYFPRKLHGQRTLESDPSIPAVDDTGAQLLKHARVYTLAEKFGVAGLKTLASSKIHCINSTVKGEIEYARYVYANTSLDDTTIRAPVASFWATRSHTLRSEAEDEFKSLCLEYPQFGYDVLTRVLDDKLKRERNDKMHPATGSVRKRPRHSSGGAA